jgi:hypothetical protein
MVVKDTGHIRGIVGLSSCPQVMAQNNHARRSNEQRIADEGACVGREQDALGRFDRDPMRSAMTRRIGPVAGRKTRQQKKLSAARLAALIEEATVDAYNESEQTTGFYTMLEDHLAMPFKTEVLGMEVVVERIDITDDDQIVAVCARRRSRQRIPIIELPLPDPPPERSEWIHAYRRWARGR